MAYDKTQWQDRTVEKPRTFSIQENPDGTITLIPMPGTVITEGTPVNAANMNKIETGLSDAHAQMADLAQGLNTHESKSATTSQKGHVELATNAEVTAGTDTTRAVTPAGLKVELDKKLTTTNLLTEIKKVDGAGSGLDADLLNGKKASEFALASVGYVSGFYTGDGAATRLINLGFTPKAILILRNKSGQYYNSNSDGFAVTSSPSLSDKGLAAITIVSNGFNVYNDTSSYNTPMTNTTGNTYHYIAFK